MSSIDVLKSSVSKRGGLAKANRYQVYFPLVGGVNDVNINTEELNVFCDSVNWPGRQIITNEQSTSLKVTKQAYSFAVEDLTVTFLLTNNWSTWNYLNAWQNLIIENLSGERGFYINYKRDYAKDIEIHHLDQNNRIRKRVKFKNAFPTTLNSMELSNAGENTILRCTATFSYDNWETYDNWRIRN